MVLLELADRWERMAEIGVAAGCRLWERKIMVSYVSACEREEA